MTEALKACPDLIIRNGEDLDRYREASRRIFHVVRQWVGPKAAVERLGMDELFIDVTDIIQEHLAHRPDVDSNDTEMVVFQRPGDRYPDDGDARYVFQLPSHFAYKAGTFAGHTAPAQRDGLAIADATHEALVVGANLADFLRQLIRHTLGFTCSAGIAQNKLVAKLAADVHKPNLQTTILMPYAAFLAPFPVRKLNGFGFRVLEAVLDSVEPTAPLIDGPGRYYEEQKPMQREKAELIGAQSKEVITQTVRETLHEAWFTDRFGETRGAALWRLLWGEDASPVVMTPTFPHQITIEDSFIHCHTMADVERLLLPLAEGLLLRLEKELFLGGVWRRYPHLLRLTVRTRNTSGVGRDARESTSAPMPVYIFETATSVRDRARALYAGPVLRLFHKLVPHHEFACTLYALFFHCS